MGDIQQRPPIFMGSFFLGHPASEYKPYDSQSALTAAAKAGTYTAVSLATPRYLPHAPTHPVMTRDIKFKDA